MDAPVCGVAARNSAPSAVPDLPAISETPLSSMVCSFLVDSGFLPAKMRGERAVVPTRSPDLIVPIYS
jgi:hypothetical protein